MGDWPSAQRYSRWGLWLFLLTERLVLAQVVLRVLFPDRYILQGFFSPNETGQCTPPGGREGGGPLSPIRLPSRPWDCGRLAFGGDGRVLSCWLCLWGSP